METEMQVYSCHLPLIPYVPQDDLENIPLTTDLRNTIVKAL